MLQEGTAWFIKRELGDQLSVLGLRDLSAAKLPSTSSELRSPDVLLSAVTFPELTSHHMIRYTEAYFNTFNVIFPVFCYGLFEREILSDIVRSNFMGDDGDGRTVIALLVFALGAVAIEGTGEHPISTVAGQPSGIRGGSSRQPPGLAIFNEARRRIGTMPVAYTLEKVQALLLQAIYFGGSACCVEFWHSITAASMACQVLVRCRSTDWASPHGDMIKRAYWTCVVNEDLFHIDLDLPRTGISAIEDEIPLPHFHEVQHQNYPAEFPLDQRLAYNLSSFLALIALRRLITRVHTYLQQSDVSAQEYGGANIVALGEMVQQLNMWRDALPASSQWPEPDAENWIDASSSASCLSASADCGSHRHDSDNEMLVSRLRQALEGGQRHHSRRRQSGEARYPEEPSHPAQRRERSTGPPNLGAAPINEGFNLDIVTAGLQTRFYYARLMVHLPFVYKALHFPTEMTLSDMEKCLIAIQSACDWPLAVAPPRNKKRLVPHLFAWTQNFIGVLLLLRMSMTESNLHAFCKGRIREARITLAATLMLDWLYDMRQVDPIAAWGWQMLEPLFFGSKRQN
ncbi:hypothetical protein KC334_g16761 [Hortaea werneckii]|nr:hypothetical protein KC334_g16761 [Hortaea werneckii]